MVYPKANRQHHFEGFSKERLCGNGSDAEWQTEQTASSYRFRKKAGRWSYWKVLSKNLCHINNWIRKYDLFKWLSGTVYRIISEKYNIREFLKFVIPSVVVFVLSSSMQRITSKSLPLVLFCKSSEPEWFPLSEIMAVLSEWCLQWSADLSPIFFQQPTIEARGAVFYACSSCYCNKNHRLGNYRKPLGFAGRCLLFIDKFKHLLYNKVEL